MAANTSNMTSKCQDFVHASRSNQWTGGKCNRPVKRDGCCGIHARQRDLQDAYSAAWGRNSA